MKRRIFLKNVGLGLSPILIAPTMAGAQTEQKDFPNFSYGNPQNLEDAKTKEGQLIVRIELRSNQLLPRRLTSKLVIKGGKIFRSKQYLFETGEDRFDLDKMILETGLSGSDTDILVLWLDQFKPETEISLSSKSGSFHFTLQQIIDQLEVVGEVDGNQLKANFLLDKEIGEVTPEQVGIKNSDDNFSFVMMADPQGGDSSLPIDNRCRMKIHNAFIEESVALANNLKIKPAFAMMVGDIVDHEGDTRDFYAMHQYLSKLKMPVLYELGNHETKYSLASWPGYNMSGFNNYFAAQKEMNGMDKLLYSFNLGKWHFVVWPDPMRNQFWENHPHYFDWLEHDLEKYKDRPTIFFQHVPIQPIGIDPMLNYVESVAIRRTLYDILSKQGNVKYVFSGHVHIPVKSSFKTAVSYRGINFINLPAAGYRPRSFGEEDYMGGPTQGVGIVEIKGDEARVTYKTVTWEEYTYPEELPLLSEENDPLWFKEKWDLPSEINFMNGSFEEGLQHWHRNFVFTEDNNPSNICEVRREEKEDSMHVLYLKTKKRAFAVPGQDRVPQDINRICQLVKLDSQEDPFLEFEYKLDGKNCDFNGINGMYVWVEGFKGSSKTMNLIYSANQIITTFGWLGNNSVPTVFYDLSALADQWHKVSLNIKNDFERNENGLKYNDLRPDRLLVNMGIWNVNMGADQSFASYFDQFNLKYGLNAKSKIDGKLIKLKDDKLKWKMGKDILYPPTHVAGEHHYYVEGYKQLKY